MLLKGTNLADTIRGFLADDVIWGYEGDDYLYGDAGNDRIFGGSGNDFINAGLGNDYAEGGDGNDRLEGGLGDDTLDGGLGNDTFDGGDGNDIVEGGDGHATVFDGVRFDIRDGGSDFIPVFLCRTVERPTSVCLFLQLLDRFRIIVIELQELCGVKFGSLPLFLWHHHPRIICGFVAVGTCLEVMHANFRDFDRIDNAFEIACVEVLLHAAGVSVFRR